MLITNDNDEYDRNGNVIMILFVKITRIVITDKNFIKDKITDNKYYIS